MTLRDCSFGYSIFMTEILKIDQLTFETADIEDFVMIYDELNVVAGRRKDKIDLLDEPYCRSKIAWKVAIFSNAMAHRFVSLAEGVALSWNGNHTLSAVLNARAMIETVAVYWEFGGLLKKHLDTRDFGSIDILSMNYLFSMRDKEDLKSRPELKARQVLDAIDLMDTTLIPHFRSHYDRLSERCHPNSAGHRSLFSHLDRKTGMTAFGNERDYRYVSPLKCALGTAVVFKHSMDSIEEDIVQLAAEHHAASPSPLVFR
jgi:hypothetical protein